MVPSPGNYRESGEFLTRSFLQENEGPAQLRPGQLCDPGQEKVLTGGSQYPGETERVDGTRLFRGASGLVGPQGPPPHLGLPAKELS